MASQIELIRENDREIVFGYRHQPLGLLVFALGQGLIFLCWKTDLITSWVPGRWWIGSSGLLLALFGIAAAFYRDDLRLDLLARAYTRRSGFAWKQAAQSGSLDDLQDLALQLDYQGRPGRPRLLYWVLYLEFKGPIGSISVASFRNEREAYARIDSLAGILRVPIVDRTGEQEKKLSLEEIRRPLAAQARPDSREGGPPADDIPPLPRESRIALQGQPPSRKILFPAMGFSPAIFVFLFFAAVPLWMGLAGARDLLVRPVVPWSAWIMPVIVTFIGLLLMLVALLGPFIRKAILETPAGISYGPVFLGRQYNKKAVVKSAVEEISVKPAARLNSPASITGVRPMINPPQPDAPKAKFFFRTDPRMISAGASSANSSAGSRPKQEVVIRSAQQIVRLGSELRPEEQEWLRQALSCMVSASR